VCTTAKTVEVVSCPADVTLQANSALRRRAVHWPEPQFTGRDGARLESTCTKLSGSEFATGSTKVDCFASGITSTGCSFVVNVVGTMRRLLSFKSCDALKGHSFSLETHLKATERHLPYSITQCSCRQTQMNAPRLNSRQTD